MSFGSGDSRFQATSIGVSIEVGVVYPLPSFPFLPERVSVPLRAIPVTIRGDFVDGSCHDILALAD